jgi:PAS domain S-box-containing protein
MDSKGSEKKQLLTEGSRRNVHPGRKYALDPLKISLIYLVFGILWIIFSDKIFLPMASRQEDLVIISSIKGALFIIVTSALLFLLIRHFSRQQREQYDALAASQAEWESTFNAISDWITLITPDGQILRTNNSVEPLLGISSDQVVGRKCFEFVHGTECPAAGCPRRRMLVSGKREITEIQMPHENRWLQVTVDPVADDNGEIVSAVHIVRDITEKTRSQKALEQAKKKLNLLNYVTFNDIQNMIFILSGYQALVKGKVTESSVMGIIEKEMEILQKISHSLKFAQSYQDLGIKPSRWQNVNQVFLMAISHLDFRGMEHSVELDNLEIFADPLLEQVFQILADNVLTHGKTASRVTLRYAREPNSVILIFEDDGVGIPADIKKKIFSPDFQKKKGVGLFLAREILEITDITISETGEEKGARFEIIVPNGIYRFTDPLSGTEK